MKRDPAGNILRRRSRWAVSAAAVVVAAVLVIVPTLLDESYADVVDAPPGMVRLGAEGDYSFTVPRGWEFEISRSGPPESYTLVRGDLRVTLSVFAYPVRTGPDAAWAAYERYLDVVLGHGLLTEREDVATSAGAEGYSAEYRGQVKSTVYLFPAADGASAAQAIVLAPRGTDTAPAEELVGSIEYRGGRR
ncbi:hypothetical protein [Salininema proteolyticum]|uniref:DUF1795 domain-containing protein n=1 Tax=Salininema proteolyticum TaxID=1607685 RepID=A0ABV8U0I3_9ACTN